MDFSFDFFIDNNNYQIIVRHLLQGVRKRRDRTKRHFSDDINND